jgi:hypothetical protein
MIFGELGLKGGTSERQGWGLHPHTPHLIHPRHEWRGILRDFHKNRFKKLIAMTCG